MRILVAGGAGFIGSHYVRTLISGGYPGLYGPGLHREARAASPLGAP
jgi:uncharacterized protein YbjT (DUF2867 family)